MTTLSHYNARAASGICVECNAAPPVEGTRRCDACAKIAAARSKRYRERLKRQVFEKYGGARCVCCGEARIAFLTLDHVNNDGATHRGGRKVTGRSFYAMLMAHGYPKNPPLQVMCYNCNCGRNVNGGVCPHEEERRGERVCVARQGDGVDR